MTVPVIVFLILLFAFLMFLQRVVRDFAGKRPWGPIFLLDGDALFPKNPKKSERAKSQKQFEQIKAEYRDNRDEEDDIDRRLDEVLRTPDGLNRFDSNGDGVIDIVERERARDIISNE